MKTLRWCLLLLLSLALPLQAALAAGMGGCIRHAGSVQTHSQAAPAASSDAAKQPTPGAAVDHADCAEHHSAQASTPSLDHPCSSCSWCGLGTALPSNWPGWTAAPMQQRHTVAPLRAYGPPALPAPERPPRARAA